MKKKEGLLFAGIVGFLAATGLIALKRFLNGKKYEEYYRDFHRHFDQIHPKEDHHGVEFIALK